jgi:hypothetical protein
MATLTCRFYGRLNDFLQPWRRGRRFGHALRAPASVKDVIESLGVPHPEVDLILVNGSAEAFSRLVTAGDDLSAFPAFRSIDISGITRAGVDDPPDVRFVVDVHLRKLAAWLRLAGFDALILADDRELAETAGREGRVALTRDVDLLKRNVVRHGYWVRHTDPERQFVEVLERFRLRGWMAPFTRCLRCNASLVRASPADVETRVPARARAAFDRFLTCPGCGRVYWQGSHYERLLRLLAHVQARLEEARAR